MADRSQSEAGLVLFSERLTNSAAFGLLFREGMGPWFEQTAAYLDGDGRTEAKALERSVSLTYATESMRLTTRLMQLASWLLLHRAVKEGEMTLTQANREKDQGQALGRRSRPGRHDHKTAGAIAGPDHALDGFAGRVRRLDITIHAPAPDRSTIGNPLVPQLNRLKAAFER